jgi:uncharacterized protein (TIGR02594 family)
MPAPIENLLSITGAKIGANTAMIQDYLRTGGQNLNPVEKAWCAAAVNASLAKSGIQGTGSNMARSFLNWGAPTEQPKRGDIAVFSRGDPKGPYGHVGFYEGRDENGNIRVAGGNQGRGVSIASYPSDRLLGFRTYGPNMALPASANEGGTAAPDVGPAKMAMPGMTLNSAAPAAPPADAKLDLTTKEGWGKALGDKDVLGSLEGIGKALGGGGGGQDQAAAQAAAAAATINPSNIGSGVDAQLMAMRQQAGPMLANMLKRRTPGLTLGGMMG